MTDPIYKGEAILRSRGENDKGRWVRIEIEDDGGVHPFKGLEGERFAVVIVGPLASTDHGQVAPVVGVEPGGDSAPSIAAPPVKQRKRWEDLRPSARAAMRTSDREFWEYITEAHGQKCFTEATADAWLKNKLAITSKSELDTREDYGFTAAQFAQIESQFEAWRLARAHGQLER